MEEKVQKYLQLQTKYATLTVEEIWDHFLTNHYTNYIQEIRNLDCDMSIKVKLMQKFFDHQNDMIQARQSLCQKQLTATPITISLGADLNVSTNENSEATLTRSGRVSKKPLFLLENSPTELAPSKSKESKEEKPTSPILSRSRSQLNEETQKIYAEYKSATNSLFDLDFEFQTKKEPEVQLNENKTKPANVTPSVDKKTNVEEVVIKKNRFFKSKNTEIKAADDETKDDESISISSDNETLKKKAKPKRRLGEPTTKKPRLGLKQKDEKLYQCPLCNEEFSEKEITIHASGCGN